jgi:hypothetical protein
MRTVRHIFVDDGSPEARDDANNYVCFEPDRVGSYEAALAEVRRRQARLTGISSPQPKQELPCSRPIPPPVAALSA